MALTMAKMEMIFKLREIGINKLKVRPMKGGWAILQQIDPEHAESILITQTKEECDELIKLAAE